MKSRVLLVHHHYDSSKPSGEARVVAAERDLLRRNGHVVTEFYRHSDDIIRQGAWGLLKGGLSTPWNPFAARAVRAAAGESSADVVHVHNTFPLLSPSIFHAIGSRAARVLTLHNYRLFCAAAMPLRDGNVCTQCMDRKSSIPALKYACYRNSRLATAPLAFGVALHRFLGTWNRQIDAFIVFTHFQRDLMVQAGLDSELIHVKPNFFPGTPELTSWAQRAKRVVFVGRLGAEKGVESLVRAWLAWGPSAPQLRIVGEGELKSKLMSLAATAPDVPIAFLGQVGREQALAEIAASRLLVMPSQWFEGFPVVLAEAFAHGTPVAVAEIGPLPAIVESHGAGVVFSPGDAGSLLAVVQELWAQNGLLERMAGAARRAFDAGYSEQANYATMMDVYRTATEVSRRRARP